MTITEARWVVCDKYADWSTSQHRHLLPHPLGTTTGTTLCGATGLGLGVWEPLSSRTRKPKCPECDAQATRRSLEVYFDVPPSGSRFRVERYDSAYGGWRAVPKSFTDDSANSFPTRRAAMAARRDLERHSSYSYRVVPVPRSL